MDISALNDIIQESAVKLDATISTGDKILPPKNVAAGHVDDVEVGAPARQALGDRAGVMGDIEEEEEGMGWMW